MNSLKVVITSCQMTKRLPRPDKHSRTPRMIPDHANLTADEVRKRLAHDRAKGDNQWCRYNIHRYIDTDPPTGERFCLRCEKQELKRG